ncbi:MAG: Dolichyl-diphosphooligosaccharide--protein glycosyltransferase subunit stt3b [Paramarteilia canceri]
MKTGFSCNVNSLLVTTCLVLISFLSVLVRIKSSLNYESIVHDPDSTFNLRMLSYLSENGYKSYLDWYDEKVWYPVGRDINKTTYHGMMLSSNLIHKFVRIFSPQIRIVSVAAHNGSIFTVCTIFSTYFLNKELFNKLAGVLAALFIAIEQRNGFSISRFLYLVVCLILKFIVPSFVTRTHAGAYDYESISFFFLVTSLYYWIKSLKANGSMIWASMSALFYFFFNATWGGYSFLSNLIPVHVLAMSFFGQFTPEMFQSYATFTVLIILGSFHVPMSQKSHISSPESIAPLFTLLVAFVFSEKKKFEELRKKLSNYINLPTTYLYILVTLMAILFSAALSQTKILTKIEGRVYSLLDKSWFLDNEPIISSVSEHSLVSFNNMFFQHNILLFLSSIGPFLMFIRSDPHNWILIISYVFCLYFGYMMSRLNLFLAPSITLTSGFAVAELLFILNNKRNYFTKKLPVYSIIMPRSYFFPNSQTSSNKSKKNINKSEPAGFSQYKHSKLSLKSYILLSFLLLYVLHFVVYSVRINKNSFSGTGFTYYILHNRKPRPVDDVKQAYMWLRNNGGLNAKIVSWWDYGYHLAQMAKATVFVDNFTTYNYYRIAMVGLIMSSPESQAIGILRALKATHILSYAPGIHHISSTTDISKQYWMISISQHRFPLFVNSNDFISAATRSMALNKFATEAMHQSMLYKTCFFDHEKYSINGIHGLDKTSRTPYFNALPENGPIKLQYIDEAFSSEFRTVRIFNVKPASEVYFGKNEQDIMDWYKLDKKIFS